MSSIVDRLYLYVPPEEWAEVEALGACRDEELKCWYILAEADATKFSQWLPGSEDDEAFSITSEHAFVARTRVPCWKCHASIEVICIYCDSGTEAGEPLTQFVVSGIWAMDAALAQQLEPWPFFRKGFSPAYQSECFVNHCLRCGTLQEDMFLHGEPDDPLFQIPHAGPDSIQLTPLVGRVQLSGDCRFEV